MTKSRTVDENGGQGETRSTIYIQYTTYNDYGASSDEPKLGCELLIMINVVSRKLGVVKGMCQVHSMVH